MLICDNHVLIKIISFFCKAPVAQLDRAPDYGSGGLWFMSYGEPNKTPKNLIPKHQTIFLVSL